MRRLLFFLLVCLFAVGCSGGEATGTLASSPVSIGTGEQRILIALIDPSTGGLIIEPELTPLAVLRDDIGAPLGEYQGEFLWSIPDVAGLYRFRVEVPGPATYQLTIDTGEFGELAPIGFVASDDPPQVTVGEPAPRSESRTLEDAAIDDLTSDPTPEESFYEMTVAEAVDAGPSVLVFATPAWCTSQTCGPMLDQVQTIKPEYPDLNYVHVEIYENIHVTNPDDLVPVPTVAEWGLPSEPWLYVTDENGMVAAAFEGAVSDEELRAALETVSG